MSYVEELRDAVGPRPLLLAGTALIATDPGGKLLLQQRSDDEHWALVGGFLEIGESPEEAIRREAREEVGLEIGDVRLFDVLAGRDFFHDYPGQGRVYSVNIVYQTSGVNGTPRPDREEVLEVGFFASTELPSPLERISKLILDRFLADATGSDSGKSARRGTA